MKSEGLLNYSKWVSVWHRQSPVVWFMWYKGVYRCLDLIICSASRVHPGNFNLSVSACKNLTKWNKSAGERWRAKLRERMKGDEGREGGSFCNPSTLNVFPMKHNNPHNGPLRRLVWRFDWQQWRCLQMCGSVCACRRTRRATEEGDEMSSRIFSLPNANFQSFFLPRSIRGRKRATPLKPPNPSKWVHMHTHIHARRWFHSSIFTWILKYRTRGGN